MRRVLRRALYGAVSILVGAVWTAMGQSSLEPPGPPGSAISTMRTMNEVQPHTPITNLPFVISNSGAFYLISNLNSTVGMNGISINADDVSLDLNGFALTGVASNSAYGILVVGTHHNISIRNGFVQKWGTGGIGAGFAVESMIQGVTAFQNNGIGIGIGANSRIVDCGSHLNDGNGFALDDGGSITGCKSTDNGGDGYNCQSAVRVEACTASRNKGNGIWVKDSCDVRQCMSTWNTNSGVLAKQYCRIIDNNVGQNGRSGIRLEGGGCRVQDNHCPKNAYGIEVISGYSGNLCVGNSCMGSLTNDYNMSLTGDYYGQVYTSTNMQGTGFSASNPWANFSY